MIKDRNAFYTLFQGKWKNNWKLQILLHLPVKNVEYFYLSTESVVKLIAIYFTNYNDQSIIQNFYPNVNVHWWIFPAVFSVCDSFWSAPSNMKQNLLLEIIVILSKLEVLPSLLLTSSVTKPRRHNVWNYISSTTYPHFPFLQCCTVNTVRKGAVTHCCQNYFYVIMTEVLYLCDYGLSWLVVFVKDCC